MAETWTETSQMTIKELAEFSRSLAATVSKFPERDKLRAALDQALSAECVTCGIRLGGFELLKFEDETSDDARVERLRSGYCARNGCDSHFYRVHCAPHSQLNWPSLLSPAHELTADEKAAADRNAKQREAARRRYKAMTRAAMAVAALNRFRDSPDLHGRHDSFRPRARKFPR